MDDIIPENEDIAEMLAILKEFDPNPEAYPKRLWILYNNLNERRYYQWVKQDLYEYIQLVEGVPNTSTPADNFERRQFLYKKLKKGNVIPYSIEYANNIPWKSGEVVTLSKARARGILDGK